MASETAEEKYAFSMRKGEIMAKVCFYFQELTESATFPYVDGINSKRSDLPKSCYHTSALDLYIGGYIRIEGRDVVGGSRVLKILDMEPGTYTMTFFASEPMFKKQATVRAFDDQLNRLAAVLKPQTAQIFIQKNLYFEVTEGNNYFLVTGVKHIDYIPVEVINHLNHSQTRIMYRELDRYTDSYDATIKRSSAAEYKEMVMQNQTRNDVKPELRDKPELTAAFDGILTPNAVLMDPDEHEKAEKQAVEDRIERGKREKRQKHPVKTFFTDAKDKIFKKSSKTSFGFKLLHSLATVLILFVAFGLGIVFGSLCVGTVATDVSFIMYVVGALYAAVLSVVTVVMIWKKRTFYWAFVGFNAIVPFLLTFIGSFL